MKRHLLSAGRPDPRRRRAGADHRRRDALAGGPADQEAARPARPHRGQPLLRGLHPHPDLLRGRGQAAQRRRHQLLRQGLQPQQGREPQGHRADPRGDGRRRGRGPPRLQRRAAPARALGLGALQRGQRRRRHPRAPDPGAARRVHDVEAPRRVQAGRPRGPPGRDRRRRPAQPGGPVQRAAAAHAGRRGDAGGAADPAAGRHRVVAGRDVVRPRRGDPQGGRRDDAAGPARADGRGVLPDRRASTAAATASTAAGWRRSRTTRSSCTPARWSAAWRSPPTSPTRPAR